MVAHKMRLYYYDLDFKLYCADTIGYNIIKFEQFDYENGYTKYRTKTEPYFTALEGDRLQAICELKRIIEFKIKSKNFGVLESSRKARLELNKINRYLDTNADKLI